MCIRVLCGGEVKSQLRQAVERSKLREEQEA
jgi:hypothetical protein